MPKIKNKKFKKFFFIFIVSTLRMEEENNS